VYIDLDACDVEIESANKDDSLCRKRRRRIGGMNIEDEEALGWIRVR
jgi:hypothetical protein